jgi:adenine deaminase
MSNIEALKTATIHPANYIGAGKDIGSLKVGKMADLLVLVKNPLEDIQNTNSLIYTMMNGRLYDSNTMNEVGNHPKERQPFYWENNRYNASFPWNEASNSFMEQQCCGVGHN